MCIEVRNTEGIDSDDNFLSEGDVLDNPCHKEKH